MVYNFCTVAGFFSGWRIILVFILILSAELIKYDFLELSFGLFYLVVEIEVGKLVFDKPNVHMVCQRVGFED